MTEDLPAIELDAPELRRRAQAIHEGDGLAQVRNVLGGEEFQTEQRGAITARFWRFRMLDAREPWERSEIYLGEFEGDRLVFGAVIPRA
ncbi:MAG: hypothetical protein M3Q23_15650 [Actinomycetota bacterium]|nr:hypothetical protein [Actinomycetota bacterium]